MRQPVFWNLKESPESAELRIDGEIVADEAEWFYQWFGDPCTTPGSVRAQLKSLGKKPLTVWIDSPGGNVEAGAAIYTALMEYPGEVTAKIEARAYSAASVIAMACATVLISPVATMMIHLPWTSMPAGNEHDARHIANVLAECGETLLNAYEIKTGMKRDAIRALLDADNGNGTWMSAKKAVELGFADGLLYGAEDEKAQAAMVAQARAIYAMTGLDDKVSASRRRETDWIAEAEAMLAIEDARM